MFIYSKRIMYNICVFTFKFLLYLTRISIHIKNVFTHNTRKFSHLHDTCSSRKNFLAVEKIFSCLKRQNPLTNSEKFEAVHIRLKSITLDELEKFSEFQEK